MRQRGDEAWLLLLVVVRRLHDGPREAAMVTITSNARKPRQDVRGAVEFNLNKVSRQDEQAN